jgi:exodeoxyribonuclease VII small subunit
MGNSKQGQKDEGCDMKKSAKTKTLEGLTFEQAFKELEESVSKLESGELPLEESLALYERGQALAAYCGKMLDEAELKIEQVAE